MKDDEKVSRTQHRTFRRRRANLFSLQGVSFSHWCCSPACHSLQLAQRGPLHPIDNTDIKQIKKHLKTENKRKGLVTRVHHSNAILAPYPSSLSLHVISSKKLCVCERVCVCVVCLRETEGDILRDKERQPERKLGVILSMQCTYLTLTYSCLAYGFLAFRVTRVRSCDWIALTEERIRLQLGLC